VSRVAYVNGRYLPHAAASVSIEDRGFQFADAVYEVWAVFGGKLADSEGHAARLERSLAELRIAAPMSREALICVLREVVRRNRVRDGLVYLQVSRGQARRDHAFPTKPTAPTLVVTARSLDLAASEATAQRGVSVIALPETRWARCDIKTVGLLPNSLAKQAAREAGAYEAWFVDSAGQVTEGASTNAWIVTADGVLVTRDTGANILRGITRAGVLQLAAALQMPVEERAFTLKEAKMAREAFVTSATAFVTPVIVVDGTCIGEPGPVAKRLRSLYLESARASAV
jgi:D-alanine transaminase